MKGQIVWMEVFQPMPASSQVQATQSFKLVSWSCCCMTGACLSPAVSVYFTVVAAIQIPTSAVLVKVSSSKTCFTPANSQDQLT